jgi:hypothetical protein
VHANSTGVLQKLARVFKEKASQDLDRIMKGTSKTRERLGVVEELFTYWVLEDADQELEELEDALIVSPARTAAAAAHFFPNFDPINLLFSPLHPLL